MDQIKKLPLEQYLKIFANSTNTAKQENKLLKGQASTQRPGTGPIKKGKNKKKKELKGPKEPKGLKNQKDQKGQKGQEKEKTNPALTETTSKKNQRKTHQKNKRAAPGNQTPGGRGKSKRPRK